MPPTLTDEGLTAAREIHRRWPDVGVLVLSTYVDTAFATELITRTQRSVGYLLKDRVQDTDELVDALGRLHKGGSVVDPEVVARLIGRRRTQSPIEQLSERARDMIGVREHGRSTEGNSPGLDHCDRIAA